MWDTTGEHRKYQSRPSGQSTCGLPFCYLQRLSAVDIDMMEDNMETQVFEQWNGFHGEAWKKCIDVQDFIHQNVASYEGDDSFLMGATERTQRLMQKLNQLLSVEQNLVVFWILIHRKFLL